MTEQGSHANAEAKTLIFACSGGADVGEIADRAARSPAREGHGKMFCLAGIGARLPNMVRTAEQAETILAIDGCIQNCASQCLLAAGISGVRSLRLAELGFEKGAAPVDAAAVARVSDAAKPLLA